MSAVLREYPDRFGGCLTRRLASQRDAETQERNARNERTNHKEGGSVGKQGAHGTGKVKSSSQGGSSKSPDFKPASEVLGAPIHGEHDVPGTNIVKGSSSVSFEGPKKGNPGKPLHGGKVQKPKGAIESGY